MFSIASEAKLTEVLGRIWAEYPNGMLDISETALAEKDLDAFAVEEDEVNAHVDEDKDKGDIMSFEEMGRMRETILAQLKYALDRFLPRRIFPIPFSLCSSVSDLPSQ